MKKVYISTRRRKACSGLPPLSDAHVFSAWMLSLESNCFDSLPPKSTFKGERPEWPIPSSQSSDSCQNLVLTVPQLRSKMEKSPSLNNWNPMKEEFNDDKFNSYETGLSGNMGAKKGNQEFDRYARQQGFQFYVSGIPNQMTQDGLTNLFSRAGKVVSCKICKSDRQDSDSTFGFVGMSTVSELSKAHTQLNNYTVGNQTLKLRIAKDTEKYLKERNEMPDNTFQFSGGESQSSHRSPRRMDNRYGSRERSSSEDIDHQVANKKEAVKEIVQTDLKKPYSFKSSGAMLIEILIQNNLRMPRVTDKPLVLRADSAQLRGMLNDVVINVNSTGLYLGELEPEDLKNVSAQIQRSRHSSSSDQMPRENATTNKEQTQEAACSPRQLNGSISPIQNKENTSPGQQNTKIELSQNKVSAPCLNCGRPGVNCCSICKSTYCSRLCQQKHWPSHKLHCKSILDRLKPSEVAVVGNDNYIYLKDVDVCPPHKQELMAVCMHIVSPDEIWLQFNQPKSRDYATVIVSMTSVYENANHPTYNPKVGTLCAATADDEWYRGVVNEIKNDNIVSIRFVDYGDVRDIPVKDLRQLNEKFTKIPLLASQCRLSGVQPINDQWSAQTSHYLSQMLLNNQIKLNLETIENGVYPATITTTEGVCVKQHLIDEGLAQLKQSARVELPSLMDKISTGDKLDVMIMTVKSVSAIYTLLRENAELLIKLQETLLNRYSILPPNKSYSPQVGEVCATKYVDEEWYRGRILARNGSKVEVLYVDYGNKEVIPITDCHLLPKDLLKLAPQGIVCSLANSNGSHEDTMQSLKQMEGKPVNVVVVGKADGVLRIEFDDSRAEIKPDAREQNESTSPKPSHSTTAIKEKSPTKFQQRSSPAVTQQGGYNKPMECPERSSPSPRGNQGSYQQRGNQRNNQNDWRAPGNYEQRGNNSSFRNNDKTSPGGYGNNRWTCDNNKPIMAADCQKMTLTEGKMETAMIVVANGPSNFYIQTNDPKIRNACSELREPMSDEYNQIKDVYTPIVGELCIAKYSDGNWYRVEVLSIGTYKVNMKFVDYGNIDPVRKEDVRRIKDPYSKIVITSVQCGLSGVAQSDDVEDKISQEFVKKFLDKVVGLRSVGTTAKGVNLVEVFDKKDANRPINKDFSSPSQSPRVNDDVPAVRYRELQTQGSIKVAVGYVFNPSEFYCTTLDAAESCVANNCAPPLDASPRPKILLIGDSMVRDVDENTLGHDTVECLRGRRVIDIKHRLEELPVQDYSTVIIASTNDCTSEADEAFAEFVYDGMIDDLKRRAPESVITISTVCPRVDDVSFQVHVDKLNDNLRRLSAESSCVLIDNDRNFKLADDSPDVSMLDKYGLHLSRVGTRRLVDNINNKHGIICNRSETQPPATRCANQVDHRSDIAALNNLMEKLNVTYADKGKNTNYIPRKGEMCCSIFADDQSWYRALVLDVNSSSQSLSVQYIDYGNKERVAFASVHPLDKEFYTELPCLAIKCSLAETRPDQGKTWSEGAIERFKEAVGHGQKCMTVKLMSTKEGWNYVEITDPDTNEVLNKVFQSASRSSTAETSIYDMPLTSHKPMHTPSSNIDDLRAMYEVQKREIEMLKEILEKR